MSFREQWLRLGVWLNNFDIKPAKPIVAELFVAAEQATDRNDITQAISCFEKILAINNQNREALLALSEIKLDLGEYQQSIKILKRASKFYPNDEKLYDLLARAYKRLGKLKASIKAYQQVLTINPNNIAVRHLLDGMLNNNPVIAPRKYIEDLFNGYADSFEHNLVDVLGYRAHGDLVTFMRSLAGAPSTVESILDLGCGTGLLGQEFATHYKPQQLIGVDLAPNMLAKSQAKNIYSELHTADLTEYLRQSNHQHDIIGCTDVLVYVGDLSTIFSECHRVLKPGGYFGFSVEILPRGDFKLTPTGRYQHSLDYLSKLSSRFSFSKIYSKAIDLRKECGNIVPGYLVLLQK